MGNGLGTALANRVAAHLGGVADEVALMRSTHTVRSALVTSGNSYTMDQKTQDAAARNPRWVPAISTATAASNGAHVGTHAAAEAARVIFRFGLWPAALELWGIAPTDPKAKEWEAARWKDGQLVMPGLAPLPLPAIAAKAHARNGVTGAMAHSFNRWAWSRATFAHRRSSHGRPTSMRSPCAGARGKYVRLDRSNVKFPPTDFNRIGPPTRRSAARWSASRSSARPARCASPKPTACSNAGRRWFPRSCWARRRAASRWASVTRCSRRCRSYEDGPGNGKWNLGQYLVARGSDLPLHDLEIEILPPVDAERAEGHGGSRMIPVVPALLNAIFDATGRRFRSLPVTQSMLKGALQMTSLTVTINGRVYGPRKCATT